MMKHLLLLATFILPLQAFAGSFMFGGKAAMIEPVAPVVRPAAPPKPVAVTPDDKRTEAVPPCPTCGTAQPPPRQAPPRIDLAKVAGATIEPVRTPAASGTGDECMRMAILKAAQNVVKNQYGNRPYSGGWCAQGVRTILNASGMTNSGGMGDAITWHLGGVLKSKGFKNIMSEGFTAKNAPPGAVLVFRGPATDMSQKDGGLPAKRYRRGRSAGNWVGHVSIKGEVPNRYYTDGRTEAPAIAGRTLVAVYVPVTCVGCRRAAAQCGE